MKNLYFIVFIVSMLLMPSCATIFYGTHQDVSFYSEPPGADIYVNGVNTNQKTPSDVNVKRRAPASFNNKKNEQVYTLKKEGYHDSEYRDKASVRSLILYFDFAAYIIPGLIDLAAGSHLAYEDQVFVKLNPNTGKTDTIIQKQIVYVPTEGNAPKYTFQKNSDVDKNIPVTPRKFENRFALIIGNEDYSSFQTDLSSEVNVAFARNDASAFKEYALNILGVPSENIIFMLDATTGKMNQGISKINLIMKASGGNAEVFVYYAGHGLPDEQTKEAYIMPVDVSGKNAAEGIALKGLYQKLTEYPSKKVVVFIDACFSGGARNQGLLAARGVKINPKENPLSGNLVVFSASSGEQSSLPYNQKEHGFFTYYLLKRLQETGGNLTFGELSDYISNNVSVKSVIINDKEQNPKVNTSQGCQETWANWKISE